MQVYISQFWEKKSELQDLNSELRAKNNNSEFQERNQNWENAKLQDINSKLREKKNIAIKKTALREKSHNCNILT